MKIVFVNVVMSSYVKSSIFEAIIKYIGISQDVTVFCTKNAIKGADVYFYFRPHLEAELISPSIVTVHHDLNESDPNLHISKFLSIYKQASLIVCLNSIQKGILKTYGIINTVVIPHGVNRIFFKSDIEKIVCSKVSIGFFSHYYPRGVKGEEYFLKLAENLSRDQFRFILVGKDRGRLANELCDLGFECHVFERLPYHCFPKLYSLIDMLLITSEFEGGPASLPEALASNTQVFTTKVGMVNDNLNSSLVTLLTKNLAIDVKLISGFKRQVNNYQGASDSLLWVDVAFLYQEQFLNISKKNSFSLKSYFSLLLESTRYKYHTFYLKKKIKKMYPATLDYISFKKFYWLEKNKNQDK